MTTQPQPTLRDLANKLDQLTADVDQRFDDGQKILCRARKPRPYRIRAMSGSGLLTL
ncbi:MAG: hypothetical protein VKI82_05655 [Leptolyngbya sp.]|nr:hypothetical protein [Leptolyngbya sp.]